MADQTFNDFFAGQRMTQLAAAAAVKGGVPRVLPAELYTPGPTKPYDDKVQFASVTWNRSGATVVNRGSPPRQVNFGQTDWKFATILNMAEEMPIDFQFMQSLVSDFAPVRENAQLELNRRMIGFNQRFETTRTQIVNSLFANGKVWIGGDGQVLASSTGAAITMDPGVPTGNKITKNGSGSTYNIGDWSANTTDIQGALRTIQNANVQANGYVLENIIYGTLLPSYLAANTALQPYFSRNPGERDYLLANNEIPPRFLGFNWTPARLSYSVDAKGVVTQTFPDKFIGIYPGVSSDWYEFVEGGTQVPVGIAGGTQVMGDVSMQQMMAAFKIAYGKYGYGVIKAYPTVGQSFVQGDCCGPVLKTPGTYYFGTCA